MQKTKTKQDMVKVSKEENRHVSREKVSFIFCYTHKSM